MPVKIFAMLLMLHAFINLCNAASNQMSHTMNATLCVLMPETSEIYQNGYNIPSHVQWTIHKLPVDLFYSKNATTNRDLWYRFNPIWCNEKYFNGLFYESHTISQHNTTIPLQANSIFVSNFKKASNNGQQFARKNYITHMRNIFGHDHSSDFSAASIDAINIWLDKVSFLVVMDVSTAFIRNHWLFYQW
eukprot:78963_1